MTIQERTIRMWRDYQKLPPVIPDKRTQEQAVDLCMLIYDHIKKIHSSKFAGKMIVASSQITFQHEEEVVYDETAQTYSARSIIQRVVELEEKRISFFPGHPDTTVTLNYLNNPPKYNNTVLFHQLTILCFEQTYGSGYHFKISRTDKNSNQHPQDSKIILYTNQPLLTSPCLQKIIPHLKEIIPPLRVASFKPETR